MNVISFSSPGAPCHIGADLSISVVECSLDSHEDGLLSGGQIGSDTWKAWPAGRGLKQFLPSSSQSKSIVMQIASLVWQSSAYK